MFYRGTEGGYTGWDGPHRVVRPHCYHLVVLFSTRYMDNHGQATGGSLRPLRCWVATTAVSNNYNSRALWEILSLHIATYSLRAPAAAKTL